MPPETTQETEENPLSQPRQNGITANYTEASRAPSTS
jgi:hypothetical protein